MAGGARAPLGAGMGRIDHHGARLFRLLTLSYLINDSLNAAWHLFKNTTAVPELKGIGNPSEIPYNFMTSLGSFKRLKSMIPINITRAHILEALRTIDAHGFPSKRAAKKFLIIHKGKHYPSKYSISLANVFANGCELDPEIFSGGLESIDFLTARGFKVVHAVKPKSRSVIGRETGLVIKPPSARHNERCKQCKTVVKSLLERAYGVVLPNHRVATPTDPEMLRESEYYPVLKSILFGLQNHRGHSNFVRSQTLPACDFYMPERGIILEFDESQHFTRPRQITLRMYPKSLRIGFDVGKWANLCETLNRKDNDPVDRDETRAWYDTLRDFSSVFHNIPVVRLFASEQVWCRLNPDNAEDVAWFKSTIEARFSEDSASNSELNHSYQQGERSQTSPVGTLRIGLAFPSIGKHDLKHFRALLARYEVDLLVFPEGFERIKGHDLLSPENVIASERFSQLCGKYVALCRDFGLVVLVGMQVDYDDSSVNGAGNDQYCVYVTSAGIKAVYHKHSSSRLKAFFDSHWSLEDNFPVRHIGGKVVGFSICHDMYISLIPRVLKKKGADIWINISYQNVKANKWEAVLQARALENNFLSVCTLHRNSFESNPQQEPYAFSPKGKIKLRELKTRRYIASIPEGRRAGKIYFFSTGDFEVAEQMLTKETVQSQGARIASLIVGNDGEYSIRGGNATFSVVQMNISDFLYSPEKLWEACLNDVSNVVLFVIQANDEAEWKTYEARVNSVVRARAIEFSTLFVFTNRSRSKAFMAVYQSSNYKDSRVYRPVKFPIAFDTRFLKGIQSTCKISLQDPRSKSSENYFSRVGQMIAFLQR